MSNWPEWTSPDGRIRLINADCLEVRESLPPVDVPRIYRSGNVEFRAFPDRLERVEVFPVESK